jgi:sugar-phosphatase
METTTTCCGSPAAAGLPDPEFIVTAEDVVTGKPNPAPYLLAASLLGLNPAHCIAFEDAPVGIESATAAGATVIALTVTYPRSELRTT